MSMNSHEILVPRADENRVAVLKCDTPLSLSINEIMNQIVIACTSWVVETTNGMNNWKCSHQDFNIGDLSVIVNDINSEEHTELMKFINTVGIYNLEIEIYGSGDYPANYNYDTVLVEGM